MSLLTGGLHHLTIRIALELYALPVPSDTENLRGGNELTDYP